MLQVLIRFLQNRLENILFSSTLKKAKTLPNSGIILLLANRFKKCQVFRPLSELKLNNFVVSGCFCGY